MLLLGEHGEELPVAGRRTGQRQELAVALLEDLDGLTAAEQILGRLGVAQHLEHLRGARSRAVGEDVEHDVLGARRQDVRIRGAFVGGPQIVDGADAECRELVRGWAAQSRELC